MIDINDALYRISVKAIIRNEYWKILLVYEENKQVWDLPGWWLNHWEIPEEWLKREIIEEMWLNVLKIWNKPECFITANKLLSKTRPWVWNICYEVVVQNLDFTPSEECCKIWFYDLESIKNINVLQNVKKVFNELF